MNIVRSSLLRSTILSGPLEFFVTEEHLKLTLKAINLSTEKIRVHLLFTDWEPFVIPSPLSNHCISSFGKYSVLSLRFRPDAMVQLAFPKVKL